MHANYQIGAGYYDFQLTAVGTGVDLRTADSEKHLPNAQYPNFILFLSFPLMIRMYSVSMIMYNYNKLQIHSLHMGFNTSYYSAIEFWVYTLQVAYSFVR